MSKRTKKQKEKAAGQAASSPSIIECFDCDFKGTAKDIVYNGKDDRMECPNCQSTKFGVNGAKTYVSPTQQTIDIGGPQLLDGYCISCKWRGPDFSLKVDPKTAKDLCPDCGSDEIDFLAYNAPGLDGTPAFKTASSIGKSFKHNPCYTDHPALPLLNDMVIYGGSCINPVKKDCDIYIGFDHGMSMTDRALPWTEGYDVPFPIRDTSTPDSLEQFERLVEWTAEAIRDGKSVHAGCIGGHGRTGLFFAALVAYMGVSDDPIKYVRKNYCKKAVESKKQVNFLIKHFNAKASAGSKSHTQSFSSSSDSDKGFDWGRTGKIW